MGESKLSLFGGACDTHKICYKCGATGPFSKDRQKPDGLSSECKACAQQRGKDRYERNKVARIRQTSEYRRAHRPESNARSKVRRKRALQDPITGALVREKANRQQRRWRENHPRYGYELTAAWKTANPERTKELKRFHVAKRRLAMLGRKTTLTRQQWSATVEYFGHACAYCLTTNVKLTLDHVIAVQRGGEHTEENCIPACMRCNQRKSNKPIFMMASMLGGD